MGPERIAQGWISESNLGGQIALSSCPPLVYFVHTTDVGGIFCVLNNSKALVSFPVKPECKREGRSGPGERDAD